ncbi:MAG: HlyC/CorC family transporter [Thermomicrobiales bacterium]|nr:HlyC/CorC family transporter [Thermomicrobiales bacterium]
MQLAVELAIVAILLALSAFLTAAEIALVSARRPVLRGLADEGNRAAARVLTLGETPGRFIATVQLGITLTQFFAAAVGAISLAEVADGWVEEIPVDLFRDNAYGFALIAVTLLVSFVSIVVGSLVPRTLAKARAETIALKVVRPIEVLAAVAHPIVLALTATTNLVLRLAGSEGRASLPSVTEAEILAMVETAEDEGVVEADEADLIEDALGFGNILVRSVMVPRVDVRALEESSTIAEAVDLFFETGNSRLPVFQESLDRVTGILHVKDVFRLTWGNPDTPKRAVVEYCRPAYYVPETKPISELLRELRARRTHIAIVVDEYGGMAGLVTLEDLLEELVGEIADEFDPGYEPYREVEPGIYDVDGRVSLHDLLDMLEIDRSEIEPVDAESIGGLLADRLERLPEQGDVVDAGPLRIEVREMDGYRVATARVERRLPDQPSDDELPTPDG